MVSAGLLSSCGICWTKQKPTKGKTRREERDGSCSSLGHMLWKHPASRGEALEGATGSKQLLQRPETGPQACSSGRRTGQRMEAGALGFEGGEIPGSSFGASEWGPAVTVELSTEDVEGEEARGPQVCPEGSEVGCTAALGLMWGDGTHQI